MAKCNKNLKKNVNKRLEKYKSTITLNCNNNIINSLSLSLEDKIILAYVSLYYPRTR